MKEILTVFAVLGLDLGTKAWAERILPLHQKKEIVKNHLYLWHIKNNGMAYNRFAGKRKGILLSTGLLLAFYAGLFLRILLGYGEKFMALPLAVITGGGFGNFLERLQKGRVTDFIYIPFRKRNAPIFNFADVCIVGGGIWLIMKVIWKSVES